MSIDHRPLVAYLTTYALESIFLNWTVPITSGVYPTGYCVRVVDEITNLLLCSTCGINETDHFPPQSWCSVYVFTVITVSTANSSCDAGECATQLHRGTDTLPEVIEVLHNATTYLLMMVNNKLD